MNREVKNAEPASDRAARRPNGAERRGSRIGRLVGTGLLAAAALGVQAQGDPGHGPGPGPRPGHGSGGMEGPGGRGSMIFGGSPEHIARSIDRLLDGLDATDAQRTQIRQIALAAAADLRTQRDAERGLRERGLQIFSAPSVDANAAEALRQQVSAQHEQASRRVLQAMLDVARVLTPEQRATIGRRLRDHEGIMRDRMQRMQRLQPPSAPPR